MFKRFSNSLPVTLAFLNLLLIAACSSSQPGDSGTRTVKTDNTHNPRTANALAITDTLGAAIPHAKIFIGDAIGVPFANNVLEADDQGLLTLPAAWTSPQDVSLAASGFITTSFLHTTPTAQTLKMRKAPVVQTVEFSGTTTGYPALTDHHTGHVGMVFGALTMDDINDFSLTKIISPENDTLSALGQSISLPSNISVPTQTISYIFDIKISKPAFRWETVPNETQTVVGIHAQFPVSDVIGGARGGKSVFDMINLFTFLSLSYQDVAMGAAATSQDIPIAQFQLSQNFSVVAPQFDKSLVYVAVNMLQQNSKFIPLDLKRLTPGASQSLKSLSSDQTGENLLAIELSSNIMSAQGAAQEFFSLALGSSTMKSLPLLLPQIPAPVATTGRIQVQLPETDATTTETGMRITRSDILNANGSKTPSWDVYNPIWEATVGLPDIHSAFADAPTTGALAQRWSVSVTATSGGYSFASRAAVDTLP